jgi:hypothetical protein
MSGIYVSIMTVLLCKNTIKNVHWHQQISQSFLGLGK